MTDDTVPLAQRIGEYVGQWVATVARPDAELAPTTEWARLMSEVNALHNWQQTAAEFAGNADYYRGLVVKIGEMFGPDAYVCDDGSVSQDVLCAKVPELVWAALLEGKR